MDWNEFYAHAVPAEGSGFYAEVRANDPPRYVHVADENGNSEVFESFEDAYSAADEALLLLRHV